MNEARRLLPADFAKLIKSNAEKLGLILYPNIIDDVIYIKNIKVKFSGESVLIFIDDDKICISGCCLMFGDKPCGNCLGCKQPIRVVKEVIRAFITFELEAL